MGYIFFTILISYPITVNNKYNFITISYILYNKNKLKGGGGITLARLCDYNAKKTDPLSGSTIHSIV